MWLHADPNVRQPVAFAISSRPIGGDAGPNLNLPNTTFKIVAFNVLHLGILLGNKT